MRIGCDIISVLLKDEAYSSLIKMINEGKIKYDETYSLNKIAVELNMSRTPVRDAIQKLCEERRIDLFPSRGFRLHKMSSSEILQIYHFTMAIEGYCVICLAKAHNSEDKKGYIEKLRILLDQMKECVSDSVPFADFYRPDNEFHHVIISSLEDEHFNELSDSKNGFYDHPELHLTSNPVQRKAIINYHQRIFDAVCSGDPCGAYNALLEHADSIYSNYVSQTKNP